MEHPKPDPSNQWGPREVLEGRKLGGRGRTDMGNKPVPATLFPLSINPKMLKAVYYAKKITEIKHFSSKNHTSISSKKKMRRIVMESRGSAGD